ncbi:hypothetical protein CB0940_08261 [Cercospora beticola]|uniref:Uncharacterized protein n=1 Tax=Cercospora beticola TaxID=122368 RepID=A0A2G5HQS4_CERBT|nr:hypothetical protein CB0940_08261 [Cercospora beticola]PIA94897.1 hypothetical protein CB0940_08261 [Cercospora beticola]
MLALNFSVGCMQVKKKIREGCDDNPNAPNNIIKLSLIFSSIPGFSPRLIHGASLPNWTSQQQRPFCAPSSWPFYLEPGSDAVRLDLLRRRILCSDKGTCTAALL